MKIKKLRIKNFKSIRDLVLEDLENALILVGKNSTGKTVILDAIRVMGGLYQPEPEDFAEDRSNIQMQVELEITEEDLKAFWQNGRISRYRRWEVWLEDFRKKLPSYQDGILTFSFEARWNGTVLYLDGETEERRQGRKKNNPYIREVFPQICYIDTLRNLEKFQKDLLYDMEDDLIRQMRSGCCMFDRSKKCCHCFDCMGVIRKKSVEELNAFETARLLDYKLYELGLDEFSGRLNENFQRNGGQELIVYSMNRNIEQMLSVTAETVRLYPENGKLQERPDRESKPGQERENARPVEKLGKGMRSVYMLSLLETYAQDKGQNQSIFIVEEPEIFLHPQMQKVAGDILYRLSKKNQVIFSTHSANLLSNFNTRQIRQMALDGAGYTVVRESADIGSILDDLGYSAEDLMNVDFVFIVEGKQDKSRLPLLLKRYYSEVSDPEGHLQRIAIISTNSCTNIKTYANLKYMNQIYLKDRFLMIRDGDGRDPEKLRGQLCRYYEERGKEDVNGLPRVQSHNVLILKYYSFENYFLNPKIMVRIGILENEEAFYEILLEKWKEYLCRIRSGQELQEHLGTDLETVEDVKAHMEEIKIYLRGHNLYDIFYGRYKKEEEVLLKNYVELAPREEFQDILEAIDRFIYFENRKKEIS